MSRYDTIFDINIVEDGFNGKGWELLFPNLTDEQKREIENIIRNYSDANGILDANTITKISNIVFKEEMVIACVVGLFDRGKTFVVNALSGETYESGARYHTKGISAATILKGLSRGNLLLDTEGTNTPLDKLSIDETGKRLPPFMPIGKDPGEPGISAQERKKRKAIRDEEFDKYFSHVKSKSIVNKKLTEYFKQSVIFALSDIIILVVNELNWIDQQYIDSVSKLQHAKPNAMIIVIHNFKTVEKFEDFENMKYQYVESINNGELKEEILDDTMSSKVFIYRMKGQETSTKLIQLFLCKDGSEAGNRINSGTFLKIQQIFTTTTKREDRGSFISHLLLAANESLLKIVKNPGELHLHVNNGKFYIHSTETNPKFLQDDVEVSTECLLSLRSTSFTPKIDKIFYNNNDGLWIIADLPGLKLTDIQVYVNKRSRNLIISGEKSLKFWQYSKETQKLSSKNFVRYDNLALQYENAKTQVFRQYGQFSVPIFIPTDYKLEGKQVKMEDGQLTVWFPPEEPDDDPGDQIDI